jgi:hypothetical protein
MKCYFVVIFNLGCYCVKLEKEFKKKKVVGALIAHIDWVSLALTKMRIKSQNLDSDFFS